MEEKKTVSAKTIVFRGLLWGEIKSVSLKTWD